ncbi:MAG TPA: ParB/RepB/Spo0J family partition protein, partial [Myxococcaceae bacterium]
MSTGERGPKRALGRGLSALIPQAALGTTAGAVPVSGALPEGSGVQRIPVDAIRRDAQQPRKQFDEARLHELSESIKAQGMIQPVLVRRAGGDYRLIAGERRWRAAQLAGLAEIPAIVREATDGEAFELALVENLQRADLNPIEEAEGYRRLVDEFHLTQEQVSKRVGKDRSTVANALRLLGLPDEVKQLVAEGALDMGHARALLGAPKVSIMVALAGKVAEERLSVRETENLVRSAKEAPAAGASKSAPKASPAVRAMVDELQRLFGTKVHLHDRGGKGSVEIEFFSYEDLDRLLSLFRK